MFISLYLILSIDKRYLEWDYVFNYLFFLLVVGDGLEGSKNKDMKLSQEIVLVFYLKRFYFVKEYKYV